MSSSMVVVPEPSVKGCGPLLGVAVERAVGPATEHRADEALRLPIGLGPVGSDPQVTDSQRSAGDRVDGRDVGAAVICEQLLDLDPVAAVERPGSAKEGHRGRGFLVGQHLGIGQSCAVVDRDMHELPADRVVPVAVGVPVIRPVAPAMDRPAGKPVADQVRTLPLGPLPIICKETDWPTYDA